MSVSFQETGFSFEEIKDSIFPTMVPPFKIYLQSYFWDKKNTILSNIHQLDWNPVTLYIFLYWLWSQSSLWVFENRQGNPINKELIKKSYSQIRKEHWHLRHFLFKCIRKKKCNEKWECHQPTIPFGCTVTPNLQTIQGRMFLHTLSEFALRLRK